MMRLSSVYQVKEK